jgi:hemerythrin-like metal-binding protein
MRHFRWGEENEVFLAQIDAEHRDLFRIADKLQQAVAGKAAAAVNQHLHALIAHAEEHFSHEEWLMQSVKYSSYGWHLQQHNTARRRLKLFAPLVESGDSEAAELLLDFLEGWLRDHSGVTDRMMAAYVRNYERANATSALERWGRPLADENGPPPKFVRFCEACNDYTSHEIRPGGSVCLKCVASSVSADLKRD